jgi:hypothetical protein
VTVQPLHAIGSVALVQALNGASHVTLKPNVGQWWLPSLMRVSTTRNSTATNPNYQVGIVPANSTVYLGKSGINLLASYVDSTVNGSGDNSSVIAGTVMDSTDALTAIWQGGNPLDTAVFEVIGVVSDIPPTLDSALPPASGHPFSNQPVLPQFGVRTGYGVSGRNLQPINFGNPGNTFAATVLDLSGLPLNQSVFLRSMEWLWRTSAPAFGYFTDGGINNLIGENPTITSPRYIDFKEGGYQLISNKLLYIQADTAVANTTFCNGTLVFDLLSQ